jgi:hypothetical protein
MIYRGPGFLADALFGSSPTPSSTSSPEAKAARHRKAENKRQLADGRRGEGVGEEPNHTAAKKPAGLYKSFNTL